MRSAKGAVVSRYVPPGWSLPEEDSDLAGAPAVETPPVAVAAQESPSGRGKRYVPPGWGDAPDEAAKDAAPEVTDLPVPAFSPVITAAVLPEGEPPLTLTGELFSKADAPKQVRTVRSKKKAGAPAPATAPKARSPKKRRSALLVTSSVVLVGLGAGLVYTSLVGAAEDVPDAPVPAADFQVSAVTPVLGDEIATTGSGDVDAKKMGPDRLLIPALDVYAPIDATDEFEGSRYNGFDTLEVPDDPSRTAWFSGGSPLGANDGSTHGITLVAGHVSHGHTWGALRYLYTLRGGELIYTSDDTGKVAAWKVTEVTTMKHTDFPARLWSKDGQRRLVVTTCGKWSASQQHYLKNIFVVAVPVDVDTHEVLPGTDTTALNLAAPADQDPGASS